MRLPTALCLAVMLLTACGSPEPRHEPVSFSRSGGLAGVADHLTIGADGSVRLDRRGVPPVETQLTPSERDALRGALDRTEFTPPRRRLPGAPDTFTYTVASGGSTVHVAETAVPRGLRELVELLLDITNRLTDKG